MTDDPSPPKRRGRPPLDPECPSTNVSVRLSTKQYDALYAAASRQRMSVTEMIRAAIRQRLNSREP